MSEAANVFLNIGQCLAVRVTKKAVLVRVVETEDEAWMPKTCMQFGFDVEQGEFFQGLVFRKMWLENIACHRRQQEARQPEPHWIPPKLPRLRSIVNPS